MRNELPQGLEERGCVAHDVSSTRRRDFGAHNGFTLVELLTVIAIIAVLMALLFPVIGRVKEGGRKSTAAGDVQRIVTAVHAFKAEYGKYPQLPVAVPIGRGASKGPVDVAVGDPGIGLSIPNRQLFYTLRAIEQGVNSSHQVNPRKVVFFDGKNVPDPDSPRSGFLTKNSRTHPAGYDCFFDPWERQYCIAIDYSYDDHLKLKYTDLSGENAPRLGVAAFSLGPDQSLGAQGNESYSKGKTTADDVISFR